MLHGRGGLFDRHLPDGIPGGGGSEHFRSRFSPPISAKRRSKRPAPASYTGAALAHVSPQRLARFFTRTERGYQIAKSIRDVCVFARHNVAQDPPFSKLDLISCCNVLIYLGAVLQRKVLSILHYALKPTGFLVLGPSESIGTLSESFHQVEKTHKIYCLRPAAGTPAPPPERRPPRRRPGGSPGRRLPRTGPGWTC